MTGWETRVEHIVAELPGSDAGLSPQQIEREGKSTFAHLTTWAILCEEVLDTQFSRLYFQKAREELIRRGLSEHEITEMRRFVWLTAGWLNFECFLWDWCSLDEKDIYLAIDLQHSGGYITTEEKVRRTEFARRYDTDGTTRP